MGDQSALDLDVFVCFIHLKDKLNSEIDRKMTRMFLIFLVIFLIVLFITIFYFKNKQDEQIELILKQQSINSNQYQYMNPY